MDAGVPGAAALSALASALQNMGCAPPVSGSGAVQDWTEVLSSSFGKRKPTLTYRVIRKLPAPKRAGKRERKDRDKRLKR